MRSIPLSLLLLSMATPGCHRDASDSGTATDATSPTDSSPPSDASPTTDAATSTDATPATDAGPCMGTAILRGDVGAGAGVTCGTTTADNCVGPVYVALFDVDPVTNPGAVPVATASALPGTNLSNAMFVEYEVDPAPCGDYFVSGFQDDDGNAGATPMPDSGDPVASASTPVTIPGDLSTVYADVTFDIRLP